MKKVVKKINKQINYCFENLEKNIVKKAFHKNLEKKKIWKQIENMQLKKKNLLKNWKQKSRKTSLWKTKKFRCWLDWVVLSKPLLWTS